MDPAGGVGVLAAAAAGVVSFLSPCVLPLVPGYLSAVVGVSPADLERTPARRVLLPSLLFVASFSAIFIVLGLSATAVGAGFRAHRETLEKAAAVLIVLMGSFFVLTPFLPRLNREWRVDALARRAGRGGPLVAGAAFAIAWTPCVGPTLGSILTAAATQQTVSKGGLLLAAYSAGLAVPFLVTALAFNRATVAFRWLRDHYVIVTAVSGAVLIGMGLLLLTGELATLNVGARRLLDGIGLGDLYNL